MSGMAEPNRKQRRSKNSRSVKEQQLALLMMRVHDDGKVVRRDNEPDADYFQRVQDKARQILRYQRAAKRKSARAARKRNRNG